MLPERVAGDLDGGGEVLLGRSDALLRQAQAREEPHRAALHDGEQRTIYHYFGYATLRIFCS